MTNREEPGGEGQGSTAPLARVRGQPAQGLGQPRQPLLQELPLVAGVAVLLEEPVVLLLVLQQLEHGVLQLLPVRPEDKELDDQRDVAGQAVAGLLQGTVHRGVEGTVKESPPPP